MEGFKSNEEIQAINENDNEINTKFFLYGDNSASEFEKYYILNKKWFDSYKHSFQKYNNYNSFLKVEDLCPVIKQKIIKYQNEKKKFYIPTNFIIMNQKFINIISRYFEAKDISEINKLSYDVLIFGECIMIKSNKKQNIISVSTQKQYNDTFYDNEINYIFEFNDITYMNDEIDLMKKKGFTEYLKFKNIAGNNTVDFGEIIGKEKNNIGIIIYNRNKELSDNSKFLKDKNAFQNFNIQNQSGALTQMNPYFKSILLGLNQFDAFTKGLKKIANSNNSYQLSKKFSNFFDNLSISQAIDNKIEDEFISSIKTGNYEAILRELFLKLDSELNFNKNQFKKNGVNQNNEIMAKQNFKIKHNNPSIIENLFYLTIQNKIICNNCKTINYNYECKKYLSLELNGKENDILIKDKLYEKTNKNEKCQKCQNNNCKREITIDEFPQILENEKFSTKNNFKIISDEKKISV